MSSTSTDVRKKCEKCLEYVKVHITCFKCDAVYHIYCWKKVDGAYVNQRGQLFCCPGLTLNCAGTHTNLGTQNNPSERVIEKGNLDNKDLETRLIKEEEDYEWNEFKCDACFLQFTNEEHLEKHRTKCFNKEKFVHELKEDKDFENCLHKEEDLEWNEFRCGICLLEFMNQDHLKNHYNECPYNKGESTEELNEDKADLVCTFRNEEYFQKESYEQPVKRCDDESNYSLLDKDDTCVTNMKRNLAQDNDKLVKHKYIHTHKRPFICDTCNYTAADKFQLNSHILRKHSNAEKQYKCRDCEYSSYAKRDLLVHKHIHTNEKPFKCEMCDYAAALKARLKKHVLIKHSNTEKIYKCKDCEYSAHTKANLLRHEHSHSKERPYKCDKCDYTAIDKSHLKSHILVKHSNAEKQYKCRDCEYSSYTKHNLLVHKRTHTNERPFKCDMCDYAASTKGALQSHSLVKHSNTEKIYKCGDCEYSAHIKRYLVSHRRIHTNERPYK